MLSDEEKKAIEDVKEKIKDILPEYEETRVGGEIYEIPILQLEMRWTKETAEKVQILINLIEKLQKEIEELKKPKYIIDFKTNKITKLTNDFVSKDKIKAKIEVMNTNIVNAEKFDCDYIGQCRFAKYVLQSLLEKE